MSLTSQGARTRCHVPGAGMHSPQPWSILKLSCLLSRRDRRTRSKRRGDLPQAMPSCPRPAVPVRICLVAMVHGRWSQNVPRGGFVQRAGKGPGDSGDDRGQPAASLVEGGSLTAQEEIVKAGGSWVSTLSSDWRVKGLLRKANAPCSRARWRVVSEPKAVMTMTLV